MSETNSNANANANVNANANANNKKTHYDTRINYCSKKIAKVLTNKPHLEKFISNYNDKNKWFGYTFCHDKEIHEIKNNMPNECKCMFIVRACLNTNFNNNTLQKNTLQKNKETNDMPPYLIPP